jgi:ABC-type spermidine/putrescine transport system permease subunit II
MEGPNKWLVAAILGPAYLAALIAVQWPFADLMISSLARNWFFGMNYFGYFMRPQDYHFAWQFEPAVATRGLFWLGLLIALVSATISTRIGLALGGMLRRLRR